MDYFKIPKARTTFDGQYIAENNEVYINIIVPQHRGLEGPLIVFDENTIYYKTHALCLGSNSNRTKVNGDGDTPTGRAITSYYPDRHKGEWSFGNYGFIELTGESGEFLTATNNGRAGIGIHCGHTSGYYRKSLEDLGNLMNTHGCIRVYNAAMKELGELYTKFKKEGKKIYCYIEDYNGDIKDVYQHYEFDSDPKDAVRSGRVTTQ
ncbi:L,D-transpeptidase family protein [Gilliamella sp. Pra-s65]|nr:MULTISPECIES: L,D-transpeptidase [unclassified Gilliamella]MWN91332.1 L,D-transpeptidase family protein [Gilliamella sp. Pra-s65]MWP74146.1 L,D-transpeptidase family protein [Gilliamella sp. Pra-s52]